MKIKTSELTGAALDWAVAKCEGKNGVLHDDGITRCIVIAAASGVYKGIWQPTTNWSQGGPIKERHKINTGYNDAGQPVAWIGHVSDYDVVPMFYGPTELIAAIRCCVASRLGDEVEIPEELS